MTTRPLTRLKWIAGLALLVALTLSGCAQSGKSDAGDAMEAYFKALTEKDRGSFIGLICADWEAGAMVEFDSFAEVDASLQDVECQQASLDGDAATATCTGSILVVYDGDDSRLFSLEDYTYQLSQEDGSWRVCGYY